MIKNKYFIEEQDPHYTDLFNDIKLGDESFIRTRFKISPDIDKVQFLNDLRGELVWEYEENEDFTLDIREDGDSYILMLSKKIYE